MLKVYRTQLKAITRGDGRLCFAFSQEERDRRAALKKELLAEMHHTCTLNKLKPAEEFEPHLEPYTELISEKAMAAYHAAVTTTRRQLAQPYIALVQKTQEFYSTLRIDESQRRTFNAAVSWANYEHAREEHERMLHIREVVKRAGGFVRSGPTLPTTTAAPSADALTERELCLARHNMNMEKVMDMHARLKTNPATVSVARLVDRAPWKRCPGLAPARRGLGGQEMPNLGNRFERAVPALYPPHSRHRSLTARAGEEHHQLVDPTHHAELDAIGGAALGAGGDADGATTRDPRGGACVACAESR